MIRHVVTLLTLLVAASAQANNAPPVPYPEGYRDWRHVKSMVIQPGHALFESFGGIHHLYANAAAVEGYRSGRFPNGAVIVFDLLEAEAAEAAIVEGKRKVVGVMFRDSQRYASTGGWGFEGFAGDSKVDRAVGTRAAEACFACHQAQARQEFVFSSMRE